MIHSLVNVRLDYCNSILYGLPDNSLCRLQKIQNTAARILALLPRFSHISATLFDLHWLPIRYRITFNICILAYQAYHRIAPSYLYDLIVPYVNTQSLRSNDKCLIKPCEPRLRSYGERCFKYAGPQEWNKLPIYISDAPLIEQLIPPSEPVIPHRVLPPESDNNYHDVFIGNVRGTTTIDDVKGHLLDSGVRDIGTITQLSSRYNAAFRVFIGDVSIDNTVYNREHWNERIKVEQYKKTNINPQPT